MTTLKTVFQNIYKDTGITKTALARQLDTDRTTLYRWENGKSWPDQYGLSQIKAIAKELNPDYYELVIDAIEGHEKGLSPEQTAGESKTECERWEGMSEYEKWLIALREELDSCFFESPLSEGEKDLLCEELRSLIQRVKKDIILSLRFRDTYLPILIFDNARQRYNIIKAIFKAFIDTHGEICEKESFEFCIISKLNRYFRSNKKKALYDLTIRVIPDALLPIFDVKVVRRGLFSYAINISMSEYGKKILAKE